MRISFGKPRYIRSRYLTTRERYNVDFDNCTHWDWMLITPPKKGLIGVIKNLIEL